MLAICSGKLPEGWHNTLAPNSTRRSVRRLSFKSHLPNCSSAHTRASIVTIFTPPCKDSGVDLRVPLATPPCSEAQPQRIVLLRGSSAKRSRTSRKMYTCLHLCLPPDLLNRCRCKIVNVGKDKAFTPYPYPHLFERLCDFGSAHEHVKFLPA